MAGVPHCCKWRHGMDSFIDDSIRLCGYSQCRYGGWYNVLLFYDFTLYGYKAMFVNFVHYALIAFSVWLPH